MNKLKIDPVLLVKLKELIIIILLWIISVRVMIYFYFASQDPFMEPKALSLITRDITNGVLAGFIMGLLTGVFELFVFPKRIKNKALSHLIAVKTLVYLIAITIATIIAVYVYECIYKDQSFNEYLLLLQHHIQSRTYISIFAFGLLISIEVILITFTRNKIGSGIFFPLIIGKYYTPRLEDRIFIFIDLKSSVKIAEKLEPTQYSRMLQDCFKDLEDLIIRYKGQVYQFVGDECVITWKIKKKTDFNNPIRLFYAYKEILESKESCYEDKYGVLPTFKGAIHSGIVSAAEVGGNIKSEIAFHGDVLNTTARVIELCKKFNEDLLITDVMLGRTNLVENEFNIESKDIVELRGKHIKHKICAIRQHP